MSRLEARLLHLSNLLVGGTGLVYAWMRYLCEPADEFAVVNHPLQPTVQHAHVLVAPLLVFTVGLVWRAHVAPRLASGHRPRRRTGLGLVFALVPMVASGYLIQTAGGEAWRMTWIVVHVSTSLVWTALYLTHLVARRYAIVRGPLDGRGGADVLVGAPASRSRSASGTRG